MYNTQRTTTLSQARAYTFTLKNLHEPEYAIYEMQEWA